MPLDNQDRLIRLLDNFYTAIFERRVRRQNVILKDVAVVQDTATIAELTNTPAFENPVAAHAYDDLTVVNGDPDTDPSIYSFTSGEANRVQYGAGVCDETTMVLVFRVRMDFASTTASWPRLFTWVDDTNNRIIIYFGGGQWAVHRVSGGSGSYALVNDTFASGDKRTITVVLTATTIGIAINDGDIQTTANTDIPNLSATKFDIGSNQGAANWFTGGVLWMLIGRGTISNSDIDTLHAIGDNDPRFTVLDDFNRNLDNYLDANIDPFRGVVTTETATPLDISLDLHMDDTYGPMTDYALKAANPSGYVVVGDGARGESALEANGFGSMQFDGAKSKITYTAGDWIDNPWLATLASGDGGWIVMACKVTSDGEGNVGRLLDKNQWSLYFTDEAAGNVRLKFDTTWSGTNGQWQSAVNIPVACLIILGLVYAGTNVANHPTVYIYDPTNGFNKLTNGSGLTQSVGPPTGTMASDELDDLIVGNNAAQSASFDGWIGRTLIGFGAPTEAEMRGMMIRMIPRSVSSGSDVLHDFPDLDLRFLWYGEDATHEPLTSRAGECNAAA